MSENKTEFDIIIIGGGLAGLSLSCLLGEVEGLKIACIDRDAVEATVTKDKRTTAISYGSSKILERCGVWQTISAHGCPIQDIEILDGDSPVLLQFLSHEVAGKNFGWIVPNAHIKRCLLDRIGENDNISHITQAQAQDFNVSDAKASVTLQNEQVLSASVIVGADGRMSGVRDFMDVDVRSWTYKQQAVVCFVAHEHPHDNKAVEHFWPDGPFAILPMSDDEHGTHRSSLVFTEHGKQTDGLMSLSDEAFKHEVELRFPERYGAVDIIDNKRMSYPLSLVHAAEYIARVWFWFQMPRTVFIRLLGRGLIWDLGIWIR